MARTVVPSVIVLALCGMTSGQAEAPSNQAPPQELAPYGAVVVPPSACIWANMIYSPGAIVASEIPSRFFRCVRGSWEIITPGEALMGGYESQRSGSSEPKR